MENHAHAKKVRRIDWEYKKLFWNKHEKHKTTFKKSITLKN